MSVSSPSQIAFLRGLRQIRQLKTEPVPEAALQDILEVAHWTGSARNMLAADAHGLGSAIGWFKDASSDEAKRILGVPNERLLRTIMSIGFKDDAAFQKRQRPAQPRKQLSAIVHEDRW